MRLAVLAAVGGAALTICFAALASGGSNPRPASTAPGVAAGGCSKATAQRLVVDRVAGVLCGAFLGPGSQAMVVSLTTGICLPFVGWELYVRKASGWQHVPLPPHGGLSGHAPKVVGNDIQETLDVRRPGDTLCNPTGGTKTRTWHWNGSRLVAGSWKQVTPGSPSGPVMTNGYFKTPSGNIVCFHSPGPRDLPRAFLGCGIKSGLKPAPPRRTCQEGGYAGDRVELLATGPVSVPSCAGDPGALVGKGVARVLGYGKTWSGGGISCTSAVAGLTCRNKSSHGFFLSRAHWRSF